VEDESAESRYLKIALSLSLSFSIHHLLTKGFLNKVGRTFNKQQVQQAQRGSYSTKTQKQTPLHRSTFSSPSRTTLDLPPFRSLILSRALELPNTRQLSFRFLRLPSSFRDLQRNSPSSPPSSSNLNGFSAQHDREDSFS